jgi:type II secretory pathway component PulC
VTIKKSLPLHLALIAVNVWLVFGNIRVWSQEPEIPEGDPLAVKDTASGAISDPLSQQTHERRIQRREFRVVEAKNLFHPDRRVIAEAPSPEEARQAREASDYTLLGTVVLQNNERLAYLMKKGEDASRRYYLNETIDGYRLTSIEPTEVRLRKANEELIVKCFTGEHRSRRSPGLRGKRQGSQSKSRRDYLRERRLRKARERSRQSDD